MNKERKPEQNSWLFLANDDANSAGFYGGELSLSAAPTDLFLIRCLRIALGIFQSDSNYVFLRMCL
jgi:hypothetical protein